MSGDGRFDAAVREVFRHEGGLSLDPDDPGGATQYGISLRFLQKAGDLDGDGWLDGDLDRDGDVDVDDIRAMTPEAAAEFYRSRFWDRYGYGRFDLVVGGKVFDLAVNMGPANAHRCLQRAARAVPPHPELELDGILGSQTRGVVLKLAPHPLRVALRADCAWHYRRLVERRAALEKYLNGWVNRAAY